MKLRKLFIVLVVTAIMVTALALCINAAAIEEIQFDINNFTSVVSNEDNERKDIVHKLLDGDITCGGIYDEETSDPEKQHAWMGGIGDYVLFTFPEPTVVTDMDIYVTGNWTWAIIEFFDETGKLVLLVDNDDIIANDNPYGPVGVKKPVFKPTDETQYITVSQIKITVASLKWSRHSTYLLSEVVIRGLHEHKYTNYVEVVTPPTCALEGQALYTCNCHDEALFPIEPHGQHIYGNRVVFRDGFTNPGYKSTVCINCDTMDSDITDTIGPLFSTLGYSVREDGVGGIQLGFSPNYENIALYNELSGTTLQFGTIMGSRAVLTEGNPLKLDGLGVSTVQSGLVSKDYTSLGYDIISCRIAGFGEALNGTELIITAYIFDGYNIFYLGSETTVDVPTVSYNGLKGIVPEEE